MKKLIFSLIALISLMLSFPMSAMAGPQDFTVVNNTGWDIHHLYVSPAGQDSWGDDILGKDVLTGDEDSVDIAFDQAETEDSWDIKINDYERDVYFRNVDLSKLSTVTLTYDADPSKEESDPSNYHWSGE